MNTANNKKLKWQKVAGIGLLCSLTITACNRSDKVEQVEPADEVVVVSDNTAGPIIACDNPLVQDRLKQALKSSLNQQAQSLAAEYANAVEVSLNGGSVRSKVNRIQIDIQNAVVIQEANASGITTCQASISMTLPSEDLYQAGQIQAANNQPSLQNRLIRNNLRSSNNVIIDDAFTYIIGTQGGQIQARITGQPKLVTLVSEVIAGSAVKSVMDEQMTKQRQEQLDERRRAPVKNNTSSRNDSQPQVVVPLEPIRPVQPVRPVEPVTPATIKEDNSPSSKPSQSSQPSSAQDKPKDSAKAPKDDSVNMVIVEDESATY